MSHYVPSLRTQEPVPNRNEGLGYQYGGADIAQGIGMEQLSVLVRMVMELSRFGFQRKHDMKDFFNCVESWIKLYAYQPKIKLLPYQLEDGEPRGASLDGLIKFLEYEPSSTSRSQGSKKRKLDEGHGIDTAPSHLQGDKVLSCDIGVRRIVRTVPSTDGAAVPVFREKDQVDQIVALVNRENSQRIKVATELMNHHNRSYEHPPGDLLAKGTRTEVEALHSTPLEGCSTFLVPGEDAKTKQVLEQTTSRLLLEQTTSPLAILRDHMKVETEARERMAEIESNMFLRWSRMPQEADKAIPTLVLCCTGEHFFIMGSYKSVYDEAKALDGEGSDGVAANEGRVGTKKEVSGLVEMLLGEKDGDSRMGSNVFASDTRVSTVRFLQAMFDGFGREDLRKELKKLAMSMGVVETAGIAPKEIMDKFSLGLYGYKVGSTQTEYEAWKNNLKKDLSKHYKFKMSGHGYVITPHAEIMGVCLTDQDELTSCHNPVYLHSQDSKAHKAKKDFLRLTAYGLLTLTYKTRGRKSADKAFQAP